MVKAFVRIEDNGHHAYYVSFLDMPGRVWSISGRHLHEVSVLDKLADAVEDEDPIAGSSPLDAYSGLP